MGGWDLHPLICHIGRQATKVKGGGDNNKNTRRRNAATTLTIDRRRRAASIENGMVRGWNNQRHRPVVSL
jgi:hypothetical protein